MPRKQKVEVTEIREEGGKRIVTKRIEYRNIDDTKSLDASDKKVMEELETQIKKTTISSGPADLKIAKERKKEKDPAAQPKKSQKQTIPKKTKKEKVRHDSSSSSSSDDSDMSDNEFVEESLKTHNSYRKLHGVPPLKLSKKLCKYSREWAKHLASANTFKHRTERKYGENIYMCKGKIPEPTQDWYSEIKYHKFGQEPQGVFKSGHFSQVVWKESKKLGIAKATSKTGSVFVVANYSPAGNMMGSFASNVPKLQ